MIKTTSVKSKQIKVLNLDDCGNKVEDEEERGGQVHDLHLGDHVQKMFIMVVADLHREDDEHKDCVTREEEAQEYPEQTVLMGDKQYNKRFA